MLDVLARLPFEVAILVVALLVALVALGWAMVSMMHGRRARIRRRLAALAGHPQARRIGRMMPRRRSVQSRLKQVEGVRERKRGYRLREELTQAGLHVDIWQYLMASAALAGLIFILARFASLSAFPSLLAALGLGLGGPKLVVGIMARRRVARFTSQFADAIDVVVRGIRSGLPLGECINIIGREMEDPIGAEFRLITEGQKLGLGLHDVLTRAVERTPTAELRYFANVIAIQQQTGGNLAETLAKLSDVLRARKRMRDKVQAFASEARSSAYIIGSLPLVVISALGALAPTYIELLFTTDTGNVMLFAGGVTEVVGLLVMRKMINFDI